MVGNLTQLGFVYAGGCSCDGHTTQKYKKGFYTIKYRVKQGRYRLLRSGAYLTQWTTFENVKAKLDELEPVQA